MKTYRVIRTERVQEIQIVKAKNEDEALKKNKFDDWDNYEVISSEVEVEEVKK
jgi:hypothetical protein